MGIDDKAVDRSCLWTDLQIWSMLSPKWLLAVAPPWSSASCTLHPSPTCLEDICTLCWPLQWHSNLKMKALHINSILLNDTQSLFNSCNPHNPCLTAIFKLIYTSAQVFSLALSATGWMHLCLSLSLLSALSWECSGRVCGFIMKESGYYPAQ